MDYIVENTDKRSLPEKVLNKVGLTRADVGRSFALICGVSKYPNMKGKNGDLKPAAEDLRKLQAYLKHHEFFDEVVVLRDDQVTLANLEYFLQTYFPARLKKFPKSRFLFAYTGHGMTENNKGYLLKNTARNLHDRRRSIKVDVLKDYIDEVVLTGHHVLVLLNSCYSGTFLRRPFGKNRLFPEYPGAHAITAGGSGELAWHDGKLGLGSVFYETVLAGISGVADAEKDGIVTGNELYSYLRREIQMVTDQGQNPQMGDISLHGSRGEFFFLKRDTPLVQQERVKVSGGNRIGGGVEEAAGSLSVLPKFPWPPPPPSAYSVIPSGFLLTPNNKNYLKDVAKKIEVAFDQAGYSQKKYYHVPYGFALVSQLEQFHSDGTSKTPPDRWATDYLPPKIFSLRSYVRALFASTPGRYRVIAFVVTSQPFKEGEKIVTRKEVMSWLDDGMVILPETIGKELYTDQHYCTALIYEFEQPGKDKKTFFKPLSNLTGKDHMIKSKLWASLKQ
ncbi:caspase family protein [Desulfobulbus sp. TB]|nr:caspase family protein [Desulfobulbus sp. TB]